MNIIEVRHKIFERDGHVCYNCGDTVGLCLDHVIPKSLLPIHKVSNLLTLCWKCNFRKGPHPLSEEKFYVTEEYLIKANKIFSEDEIIIMDSVLKEYFERPRYIKRKNPRKDPMYVGKNPSGKLWKLMQH